VTPNRKLVTIVAEGYLRSRLVADIERFGASGHTMTPTHGAGSSGRHTEDFAGANVRFEVIASEDTAHQLLAHLEATYFSQFSIVAWVSDVYVARPEKYS
jgi:hypothetical protein